MCTAISYNGYAGRTLDLEYSFCEEVCVTPRGFAREYIFEGELASKYAMVGMAYMHLGIPLYYDAVSEAGLYMAALNFPAYARYLPRIEGKINLASAELIPYILGGARSLCEAREMLSNINITPDSISHDLPVTELHWHLTDGREALVIEPGINGLEISANPHLVLTNAPNFAYHATKITEFAHISPIESTQNGKNVHPYSRGMGAIGLPGDFSSSSRFIRAAFLVKNVTEYGMIYPQIEKKESGNTNIFSQISEKLAKSGNESPQNTKSEKGKKLSAFFHITDSLSVPYGAVLTDEGRAVYTVYTSCADLSIREYYYTTYEHRAPRSVSLTSDRIFANEVLRFSLSRGEIV